MRGHFVPWERIRPKEIVLKLPRWGINGQECVFKYVPIGYRHSDCSITLPPQKWS